MSFPRNFHLLPICLMLLSGGAALGQEEKRTSLWKSLNTPAQKDTTTDDYYGDAALRYENHVYKKNIRSVELRDESFMLSQPILHLGSEEKLRLSFDDMNAELESYSYTFIHCNADWEPSGMIISEYVEGFTDNTINDYRYSFNTLQRYTHFNASFPNSTSRITKSGNYILKVYKDGDPENVVITRRFMVYQSKVNVECRVRQASIIEDRNYKHELDFTIQQNSYTINNPYSDLKVVITQNNRWDNVKAGLKPVYVRENELVYDYEEENVFSAGNEFRYFDIKSIRYQSERIASVRIDSLGNQVTLFPDERRSFKRYYTQSDLNGDFLIRVQEGNNSEVEADYCYVHFFLPYDEPLTDGNLYVFGAFNAWACDRETLMKYDHVKKGYACTLYLKQGYYNYVYAFLKDGVTAADETVIEGSHYETENDYCIYVYHRQPGTFYDQLIGVKRLNSARDF